MKKSLLVRIGAGFLMGSVFAVVPVGTVQAADLYDSLQDLSDGMKAYRTGSSDMYDSLEPTAAGGAQGPVRTDMMKDRDSTATISSVWDDLHSRLGPIGGDGTN